VVRTVFLLEYLSNARLREQITATTNKVEAYNGFAKWLNFGGQGVIDTADPVEQEKHLKHNHLVANAAAVQNLIDLRRTIRELQADGYIVRREDLAQLSPYQTRRLKRFGDYTLSMSSTDPFETELVVPFPLETPRSRPPAPEGAISYCDGACRLTASFLGCPGCTPETPARAAPGSQRSGALRVLAKEAQHLRGGIRTLEIRK
jgi:hypothetical protein